MTICGYGITIVAVNFFNDPPVVQIFVHELIFKHDFFWVNEMYLGFSFYWTMIE